MRRGGPLLVARRGSRDPLGRAGGRRHVCGGAGPAVRRFAGGRALAPARRSGGGRRRRHLPGRRRLPRGGDRGARPSRIVGRRAGERRPVIAGGATTRGDPRRPLRPRGLRDHRRHVALPLPPRRRRPRPRHGGPGLPAATACSRPTRTRARSRSPTSRSPAPATATPPTPSTSPPTRRPSRGRCSAWSTASSTTAPGGTTSSRGPSATRSTPTGSRARATTSSSWSGPTARIASARARTRTWWAT